MMTALIAYTVPWLLVIAVILIAERRRPKPKRRVPMTQHQAVVDAILAAYLEGRLPDQGTVYAESSRHPSGAWHAEVLTEAEMADRVADDFEHLLRGIA